jgi:single-stranded-DNA-specific exonuclease
VSHIEWRQREPCRPYDEWDTTTDKIAAIRGISDINEFIAPRHTAMHDPHLLTNIDIATQKIVDATLHGKHITVFMDFDADGCCSGAMIYHYLSNFTNNITHKVAQRNENHGLKDKEFTDTDLLIVVDSGTNDVPECKQLQDRGIDVVIIDHHQIEAPNPFAVVVNNQDDTYPNKHLSGSGVVFKVLQVLDEYLDSDLSSDFFDLAAVGIVGDVMMLDEMENRYLISQGLQHINNVGLKEIIRQSKASTINTQTIGFNIAPVINGASRMNQIEKAVDLLLATDPDVAKELAKECIALNSGRKTKQKVATDNIVVDDTHKILFVIAELAGNMRGLVATSLANQYQRPVIVVRENKGLLEGSARGYNTASFKQVLEATGIVEYAQGHDNALGLAVKPERVKDLIAACDELLGDVANEQYIEYDLELNVDEINESLMDEIEHINKMSGKGFESVKIKLKNANIYERKEMGKPVTSAIKLVGDGVSLVKFGVDENYASEVGAFDQVEAVGVLSLNRWFNFGVKKWVRDNQLIMEDYRVI